MMETMHHSAEILFPELSYSIIGTAMDVHNGLGPGWDEMDYHRAMIELLQSKGHEVLSHDRKGLEHRGQVVDHFELDLLVDDSVILELKHIKSNFHPENFTQIINYLKGWNKRLGILINYGLERLRYQRIPFSAKRGSIKCSGNWGHLKSRGGDVVMDSMEYIVREHGLGYGTNAYSKLLLAELHHRGIIALHPVLSPCFGGLSLGERSVDAIHVNHDLMVLVSASSTDTTAADLSYLKTYMRQADVFCRILVNIGNSEIQLRGIE